jgi:flagellin
VGSTDTTTLDLNSLSVASFEEAVSGIAKIEDALTKISSYRASIGATQNRFTRALNNLNVSVENLTASSATIKNGDIAEEITELTKQQLLVQSSAAMVGQANLIPEGVLLLLQQ